MDCGTPLNMNSIFTCIIGLAALGAAGCGGGADVPTDTSTGAFVAFAGDFAGFHDWQHYDVTDDAALAGIHDGSTVNEYINAPPPHGAATFPVGTIIVKEATGGTLAHELFAAVKRGGGFNSGAPGWEWFDLATLDDGSGGVRIVWRGVAPPAGETYGGDPAGGCNSCHVKCGNDAICAKPLALGNF